MLAFRLVNPKEDKPVFVTLAICSMIVCLMCPVMSLIATVLFAHPGNQVIAVWLQKICIKLPNGIMLADLFWRSICKKLIYMGEKSDSS